MLYIVQKPGHKTLIGGTHETVLLLFLSVSPPLALTFPLCLLTTRFIGIDWLNIRFIDSYFNAACFVHTDASKVRSGPTSRLEEGHRRSAFTCQRGKTARLYS